MERAQRADRILDAAGELLLAWGYRRVTIDEIARRANVGKGTVYLHWKTKDSLLLAVMLKAQSRMQHRQLERMRADPPEILPSRMMSRLFLEFQAEPVLRAAYTDDADILGRLNETAKQEFAELIVAGDRNLRHHLEVLREHGLVRRDTDVQHQQYALLATSSGFFTSEALLIDRAPDGLEVRAGILAHTIRSTLEVPADAGAHTGSDLGSDADPDSASARLRAAATAAAPEIIARYERFTELCAQEMRRQIRD
ncbi:TetR family transcriptional regulator [Streptomyces glebosus]|uniref:TetR family transcriptional regulator n=1 Tax=Streptomyces glebosus TaxID=249580 RepID=A0A640SWG1_9ACTN|nr:TetR/AcrR family transcriptional regulator [Streptomyces glebosus]GFE15747.1 TetR family transcriptional regulator [Streptomyces glebosus]GHG67167.1 TetR family transcriptional regulator [Streptomyces glebosus]